MAVIVNPQVAAEVNNQLRPMSNLFGVFFRSAQQFSANYAAEGIGPLVAGSSPLQQSLVCDGQPDGQGGLTGGSVNSSGVVVDGRTPLLGYDVDNFNGQLVALVNWINGQAGMAAALLKPSTDTTPKF